MKKQLNGRSPVAVYAYWGFANAPCAHCKDISPHNGENKWGRISIPYKRVDQYPDFSALEVSAGKGCAFCGLLRHALQDKYSDEKIAEAEGDFHPSTRSTWPISGWNGQVTVDRAVFFTEEDWVERDASLGTDSLSAMCALCPLKSGRTLQDAVLPALNSITVVYGLQCTPILVRISHQVCSGRHMIAVMQANTVSI